MNMFQHKRLAFSAPEERLDASLRAPACTECTPLSLGEVNARWSELAHDARDPLLSSGRLRFGYDRDGTQYVYGGHDPLRLPHFRGRDIYELAQDLARPDSLVEQRGSFRLLDLGGGSGKGISEIAAGIWSRCRVPAKAVVLDPVDLRSLPKERQIVQHARLVAGSMHQAASHLRPHSFDFVVSLNALKHAPEIFTPLREGCRLLRAGGVLLFGTVPRDYTLFQRERVPIHNAVDVIDCAGNRLATEEVLDVLNRDNRGAYLFELSSLPRERRLSPDAVRYCDMIAVRCIAEEAPRFQGLFYREGGAFGATEADQAFLGRILRRSIGFVLAEDGSGRELLSRRGFAAVQPL